ncbi:MAG: nitroreductase, partial [Myxococcales bacterium]
MYDLDETIRGRRSVRGFLPTPVPRRTLEEVLELAQHAPSNCNVQPWRVYIASGDSLETLRAALVEAVTGGASPVMVAPIDDFVGAYRDKQVA